MGQAGYNSKGLADAHDPLRRMFCTVLNNAARIRNRVPSRAERDCMILRIVFPVPEYRCDLNFGFAWEQDQSLAHQALFLAHYRTRPCLFVTGVALHAFSCLLLTVAVFMVAMVHRGNPVWQPACLSFFVTSTIYTGHACGCTRRIRTS